MDVIIHPCLNLSLLVKETPGPSEGSHDSIALRNVDDMFITNMDHEYLVFSQQESLLIWCGMTCRDLFAVLDIP